MSPGLQSTLAELLAGVGRLPVRTPGDGEVFDAGTIYLAPPDHHLLVDRRTVRTTRGPRENGVRPAIDPLFRSAAAHHGPRVVGVLLTGLRDDGTAGLQAVRRSGGITVVQDPSDAPCGEMPRHALDHVPIDHVVPLSEMGELLARLATEAAPVDRAAPDDVVREARIAARGGAPDVVDVVARWARSGCPKCGRALTELRRDRHFRCRAGHVFSEKALLAGRIGQLERPTLVALRALEERARMLGRLAEHAGATHCGSQAERYAGDRDEALANAQVLRELLAILG